MDLVKIDVEGLEVAVVEGACDVLESFRPALLIEIWNDGIVRTGHQTGAIFDMLAELDYRVAVFDNVDLVSMDLTEALRTVTDVASQRRVWYCLFTQSQEQIDRARRAVADVERTDEWVTGHLMS